MKPRLIICVVLIVLAPISEGAKWGFFGHKKINELAIYTLPGKLGSFYKANSDKIIDWSVRPDQRRYVVADEGMKHYIDLDLYDSLPLPKYWNQAIEQYGDSLVKSRGIVPWNTYFVYHRLVKAMSEHQYDRIISLSADLGHYVADAHVPLHTTSNYNGQLTGQLGIHAFWESRLPELYFESYNLFTNRASYIEDVQEELWLTIMESHALVDTVLRLEQSVTKKVGEDKKYAYLPKGKKIVRMPSEYFSSKYNNEGGGLVEQRMRKAIIRVGSLWLSAWVDAGQPDFTTEVLINDQQSDSVVTIGKHGSVRSHDY